MKCVRIVLVSALSLVVLIACAGSGSGDDSVLDKVAPPSISPNGGHFEGAVSVTLSCATEGAAIHYTTDGSTPTAESLVSTAVLSVDDSVTLRVIATKSGMADSDVVASLPFYVKKWRPLGGAGISTGEARHTDIAVGSDNLPVIIFSDGGNEWKAYAKKYSGSAWSGLGTSALSMGAANYTSIAVNGTNVYTTFQDTVSSAIKAFNPAPMRTCGMLWNGIIWSALGTGSLSGEILFTSISVDTLGTPYVVYKDSAYSEYAVTAKWTGTEWSPLGSGSSSNDSVVNYTDIALDPNGIPLVVYQDAATMPMANKATVRKWNQPTTTWPQLGSIGFSPGTVDYTTIALDTADTPYVAFKDNSAGGKATVMRYNGSAWEALGGFGISAGEAAYTCVAAADAGKPWTAFRDDGDGGKAVVKKWTGSAWETVGGAACSSGAASYLNAAFGPNGKFYLVFQDGSVGGKATVMCYGE